MPDLFANPAPERTQVWSCGGGTQSAAIAALICQGRLPKPDLAVIVDTEREKGSTWEYADAVLVPALRAVGVELVRVPKSAFATVDLYAHNGDLLLPVFTSQGDKTGKLPGFCSDKWKLRIVQRWLRAQGVAECVCWLGMSTDELKRVRQPSSLWFQHYYPLVHLRLRREDCVSLVEAHGWPTPPRSACWMCPNMGDPEWRELRDTRPTEFAQAVALEAEVRQTDPHAYLHRSCVPLDQVEFREDAGGGLFGCASGHCFV